MEKLASISTKPWPKKRASKQSSQTEELAIASLWEEKSKDFGLFLEGICKLWDVMQPQWEMGREEFSINR